MAQDQENPLALPATLSPDDLDAISELSVVLAKVRAGIESSNGIATGGGTGSGAQGQLSFKDVPGATDGLKHKLQHARNQVGALPDMGRSIDEQNREIAQLVARIDRQRTLLQTLRGSTGGDNVAPDDKMEL